MGQDTNEGSGIGSTGRRSGASSTGGEGPYNGTQVPFSAVSEGEEREGEEKKKKKEKERVGIAMAPLIKNDGHISNTVNNMRWGPETHTFHLPCGECTVTLEDVALQLGLPIDGSAVTGVSAIVESTSLCYSLLGVSSVDDESNFTGLKFSWLKANFEHLSFNAIEHEVICASRAYVMHIIGLVLMPDANNNRVHLMYLPLLANLQNVRSYSWGSLILAMLYRELCRMTKSNVVDIGRCLVLLQSWALYWMPFLASVRHQLYVFPLVNR
ncbi:hypothetical protein PVK06_024796 [Gossypium arboreum]|uniref:Aminotransferase-like plant mobile domain-containing protein n=1 Tax=Gossypium arboreum TaxID=29729 RepID=A0ABR0PEY8_GOSAR|nr:hypothetical protein PVK06_024796 [Gossypium arboreum]